MTSLPLGKFRYCIITNSYNRPLKLVERSLKSSLSQVPSPEAVYFIDQNEPSLVLPREIKDSPLFIHLTTEARAVSQARNLLLTKKLTTDWLVFCDDDGFLMPGYAALLETLTLQSPQIDIWAGSIKRDDNQEFYSIRHALGGNMKEFRHLKLLMGSNFAIKNDWFIKLGGFDPHLGAGSFWGSSEETDLAWKAYFAGALLEYNPNLIVFHVRPYHLTLSTNAKKAFRYGRGKSAFVMKWLLLMKKNDALWELLEMLLIPPLQIMKGIFSGQFKAAIFAFAGLIGRIWGLIIAPKWLYNKRTELLKNYDKLS